MRPGSYDFTVAKRGPRPLRIRLSNQRGPVQITSSELRVRWTGGNIIKRLAGGGLIAEGNQVSWTPSAQEAASLPTGKIATYEWDVNGETYLVGRIEGIGRA